jgi:hypothetical protein
MRIIIKILIINLCIHRITAELASLCLVPQYLVTGGKMQLQAAFLTFQSLPVT